MPQYFAIVGQGDIPLYETEFGGGAVSAELRELNPFILHSSLDILEDLQWQLQPQNSDSDRRGHSATGGGGGGGSSSSGGATGGGGSTGVNLFLRSDGGETRDNCYMGTVDHFYGLVVTGYVTYSGVKLVMVHDSRGNVEESDCRRFYQEVHELYVKQSLNPFYGRNQPLRTLAFDSRVRGIARKHLK